MTPPNFARMEIGEWYKNGYKFSTQHYLRLRFCIRTESTANKKRSSKEQPSRRPAGSSPMNLSTRDFLVAAHTTAAQTGERRVKKWKVFVRCSTRRYALPAGPFRGSEERVERRLFIFETANRAVVKTY